MVFRFEKCSYDELQNICHKDEISVVLYVLSVLCGQGFGFMVLRRGEIEYR